MEVYHLKRKSFKPTVMTVINILDYSTFLFELQRLNKSHNDLFSLSLLGSIYSLLSIYMEQIVFFFMIDKESIISGDRAQWSAMGAPMSSSGRI